MSFLNFVLLFTAACTTELLWCTEVKMDWFSKPILTLCQSIWLIFTTIFNCDGRYLFTILLFILVILKKKWRFCIWNVAFMVYLFKNRALLNVIFFLLLYLRSALSSLLIFLYIVHVWNISCVWLLYILGFQCDWISRLSCYIPGLQWLLLYQNRLVFIFYFAQHYFGAFILVLHICIYKDVLYFNKYWIL